MKLLLVHFSDLFYGSGTAVIYRRLLNLLPEDLHIHHYISTWRSDSSDKIAEQYQTHLQITPHFASFKPVRDLYGRISRRWNGNKADLRIPGLLDARHIKGLIKKLKPDVIWWSGDYLPISTYALAAIPQNYFQDRRFVFSLYDPPGFWNPGRWSFDKQFQTALTRADAIDVIGTNMSKLVREFGYKDEVVIVNDYVNHKLTPKPSIEGKFRIVMAGQIYGGEQLQQLIDQIEEAFSERSIEVHWFGNSENLKVAKQVNWKGVQLVERGTLLRDELPSAIQAFDAGYLNFSSARETFATYSVPTKLITYLEAGLPVLYHAPEDSETHMLNLEFRFGINLTESRDLKTVCENRIRFQEGGESLIRKQYEKDMLREKLLKHLQLG